MKLFTFLTLVVASSGATCNSLTSCDECLGQMDDLGTTNQCIWCGVSQVCAEVALGTYPQSCTDENCATFSDFSGCSYRRYLASKQMSLRKLGADDDDATSFGNDDQSYGGAAEAACAQVKSAIAGNCPGSGTPVEQMIEGILAGLAEAEGCSVGSGFDSAVEQVGNTLAACFGDSTDGSQCDGSSLITALSTTFKQISEAVASCESASGAESTVVSDIENVAESLVPGLSEAIDVYDIVVNGVHLYNDLHAAYVYYNQEKYGCCGQMMGNVIQNFKGVFGAASSLDVQAVSAVPSQESPTSTATTAVLGTLAGVAVIAAVGTALYVRRNSQKQEAGAIQMSAIIEADAPACL